MTLPIQKQVQLALLYFLIAAAFGVILRSFQVFDMNMNYRFMVHGHSHIAILGWVYVCITVIFYKLFIQKNNKIRRNYSRIFITTQISLIGMLITFPLQGYAFLSIIFSTLFLFVSYGFCWFFVKNVKVEIKNLACYPYLKASLFYLVLSSIGPWTLGGIMTTLGPTSVWYRLSIYFYLHFQYNGWMLLAIIGILLFILERNGIAFSRKHHKNIFIIVNTSVITTFFLSTLWTEPKGIMYILSAVGGVLQIVCFFYALMGIKSNKAAVHNTFKGVQKVLLQIILIVLGIKLVLQLLGSFPYFANLSATIIELTMAYLHWIFLGLISTSLFLVLSLTGYLKVNAKHIYFYLVGVLFTEGLLVYKGIMIWGKKHPLIDHYNEYLFVASTLLFLGIASIVLKKRSLKT